MSPEIWAMCAGMLLGFLAGIGWGYAIGMVGERRRQEGDRQ